MNLNFLFTFTFKSIFPCLHVCDLGVPHILSVQKYQSILIYVCNDALI